MTSLLAPPLPAGLSLLGLIRFLDPAKRVEPLYATWGSRPATRRCSIGPWRKPQQTASNRSFRTVVPQAQRSLAAFFLHAWRPGSLAASERPMMMPSIGALKGSPVPGTEAGPGYLLVEVRVQNGHERTRFDAAGAAVERPAPGTACHPLFPAPLRRGFLLAYADWSIVSAKQSGYLFGALW